MQDDEGNMETLISWKDPAVSLIQVAYPRSFHNECPKINVVLVYVIAIEGILERDGVVDVLR